MAGSFSGHLIDSFLSAKQPRGPFGQHSLGSPQIATCGPLAFASQMHGTFNTQMSASYMEPSFMDLSEETAKRIASLQAKLNKKLGPEYISQRPGPGGGPKLTYAEGWKIINLANEVFGFNGWSSSVVNMTTDFVDFNEESKRYNVGVTATVRITLRDGVFHEDVGYGMLENSKSKGSALDKCKKEAVTDGVKRALRNFGNLLGNCLYDKSYTQEVIKIKVPPPKFDRSELHRRPEFNESNPNITANTSNTSAVNAPSASTSSGIMAGSKAANVPIAAAATLQQQQPEIKPLSSVPPHMRPVSGPTTASTPVAKGRIMPGPSRAMTPVSAHNNGAPNASTVTKTGLNTPVHTPAHIQGPAHAAMRRQPEQRPRPLPQQQPESHPQQQPLNPPPVQLPPDKRVSFAQPPPHVSKPTEPTVPHVVQPVVPEIPQETYFDDDSYGMNSEDDAFLAAVDLGDGDSGIGGPIDFDEGIGGINLSAFSEDEAAGQALQIPSAEMTSRAPPAQYQPDPQAQYRHPQPPRRAGATAGQGQKSAGPSDQNVPPAQLGVDADSSTSHSTPSIGGFHFPPGVNPQYLRAGGRSIAGQAETSGTGIGLKRSADSMLSHHSASAARRPLQGMGLAQSSTAANGNGRPCKREPLATLDVGDGGDVKRVRR